MKKQWKIQWLCRAKAMKELELKAVTSREKSTNCHKMHHKQILKMLQIQKGLQLCWWFLGLALKIRKIWSNAIKEEVNDDLLVDCVNAADASSMFTHKHTSTIQIVR
jgi:hypothetical protein